MIKIICKKIIAGLVLTLAGGAAGYYIGNYYSYQALAKSIASIHPIRDHNSQYQFVDPLLAYVVPSADTEGSMAAFKKQLQDYIDAQKGTNNITDASVYFSDLNRGPWIGVNEKVKYNPASMLKVVIMVSYFKEQEKNPSVLSGELVYSKQIDSLVKTDAFNSLSNLQVGKSYAVRDLINKMIIDSDNGAEILLLNNIDKEPLNAIYTSLNIQSPDSSQNDFVISPRAYSLFFRILYSATYINDSMSDAALSILSKTTFNEGLVAGVPQGTVVAHKFGEYVASSNNQIQSVELHDCGIVYYPNNPYFLCVMTKGNNLETLKTTIQDISSLVYRNYK